MKVQDAKIIFYCGGSERHKHTLVRAVNSFAFGDLCHHVLVCYGSVVSQQNDVMYLSIKRISRVEVRGHRGFILRIPCLHSRWKREEDYITEARKQYRNKEMRAINSLCLCDVNAKLNRTEAYESLSY